MINRSELSEEKLPDIKTIRRMLYAIWPVRYRDAHIVHDFVFDVEARILHSDFTYQAVANSFVHITGNSLSWLALRAPIWVIVALS